MPKEKNKLGFISDISKTKKEDDEFGFNEYVNILGSEILATEELPFTVGIFGEWGTGKTTLMHLLEEYFKDEKTKTIWFDPWEYERKNDIRDALIRSILVEISKKNSSLQNRIEKLLKKMAWLSLKGCASLVSGGILPGSLLEEAKDNIIEFKKEEHEFLKTLKTEFSEIVKKYVGNNQKLVIFIDDLDRCIPENVIIILESLKLFLDDSQCVFVLGMDKGIVEQAIVLRYKNQINLSGREYLEKIIQLPFYIPAIQYEKLNKSLKKSKLTNGYTKPIWLLINSGFGGNPRKVKRFVNAFYLVKKILNTRIIQQEFLEITSEKEKRDFINYPDNKKEFYLAKILIIQMLFPNFYDYLTYSPDGMEEIEGNLQFMRSPDKLKTILEKFPELKQFFDQKDNKFLRFMVDTFSSTEDFPKNPPVSVIKYLLLVAKFVEGEKNKDGLGYTYSSVEPSVITSGTSTPSHSSGSTNADATGKI